MNRLPDCWAAMNSPGGAITTVLLGLMLSLRLVSAGDIVHQDSVAPTRPGCENNFVLVRICGSSLLLILDFYLIRSFNLNFLLLVLEFHGFYD